MIVITGAAGFIGRTTVNHLDSMGILDILAVETQDGLRRLIETPNGASIESVDHLKFIEQLEAGEYRKKIELVYHFGAITDTLVSDENIIRDNNYAYSQRLLKYCVTNHVRLIYASSASVYGNKIKSKETEFRGQSLNTYAHFKSQFDLDVNQILSQGVSTQIVGLRYFNVYGSGEGHKGRMASIGHQFFKQFKASGSVSLFGASQGYVAGEQRRDFVYIDDVIAVNEHFRNNQEVSGIYNIGTGSSWSFNEVAAEVVNQCRSILGQSDQTIGQLVADGIIRYRPFPRELEEHYQYHTEANIDFLRESGFCREFCQLKEGINRFGKSLQESVDIAPTPESPIDSMMAVQA